MTKQNSVRALGRRAGVALAAALLAMTGLAHGQTKTKEPVVINLTISTYPLLDYCVPILVGIQKGFFEKEGVRIGKVVGSEGGGTTVRNILTGGMDVGAVSFPAAVQANIAGAPLPVVAGDGSRVPTFTLVVADNSKWKTLADAVNDGATFGFTSPGSATQALLFLTLQRAGFDAAKVKTRPTGGMGGGFTAVRGGGLGVASAAEPVFSRAGKGLRPLHRVSDNVPRFQQAVWVANPQFLKANPEAMKGFLRGRLAAIRWMEDNVEEAAALWADKAELPKEATLVTLRRIKETGGIVSYYGLGFDQDAMEAAVEAMRILGHLKDDALVPWADILEPAYLPTGAPAVDPAKFANPGKK